MKNKKFNIIFSPYNEKNPYQKILIKALNRLNINVMTSEPKLSRLITKKVWRKYNILHLHWIHPFYISRNLLTSIIDLTIFIFELIFLKIMGMKIIWTSHNIQDHENNYPRLDKICRIFTSKIVDTIIVHSKTGKNIIIKSLGIKDPNKIYIIFHGNYIKYYKNEISKHEARRILKMNKDSFIYLFFGIIRPYKGVIELIKHFKKLDDHKDKSLIIAGESNHTNLTKQIKKEIGTNKNIMFINKFIDEDKIQLYMNSANVVVLPYKNILTSGSAILAMSFGKPLIVPTKGDLPEILNKSFAFFYNSNKKGGLFRTMNIAFKNRSKISKMGKSAYNNAKKLNWDGAAKMTFEVYKNLLDF
ncbi:MAG: glycosyltransferase [Nanoarchaeota archaeon]|nr:glycosyltransferase [Nanoarchaeota archaeon]